MKYFFSCLVALLCFAHTLRAQTTYTLTADSVKLTSPDSTELIIENHTQNVPGFLFNTGQGRTIFKRGAIKLSDTSYLIGADTIKTRLNPWIQNGNTFGTTGKLGTLDNNHLDLYTNNTFRARYTNAGKVLIGVNTETTDGVLQVNGGLTLRATNDDAIYFKGLIHGLIIDGNNKIILPRSTGNVGG